MKSFFFNLSSRFPFFANRPSALERAVRQSPKSRRLRMEPLENRALLAVDAFGGAALADVGESWGPDPAPAFSASELSTDAAETTISLAALNDVPYGPYVTSEQAALIALRSNATLADETLADFGALWDETGKTTLAETETDGETLGVVAEALVFESLDLEEIEQEPLPGDASLMSGQTATSGGITAELSGGISASSGGASFDANAVITEGEGIIITLSRGAALASTTVSATITGANAADFSTCQTSVTLGANSSTTLTFDTREDMFYEGEVVTITLSAADGSKISQNTFTVAIVDAPEFVGQSDLNPNPGAELDDHNKAVNEDRLEVGFSTTNFDSDIPFYTPLIHHATSLYYDLYGDGTNPGLFPEFVRDPSSGVVSYKYQDEPIENITYGSAELFLNASYADFVNLSDTITLNVYWGNVQDAKNKLSNTRDNFTPDNLSSDTPIEQLHQALSGVKTSDSNALYAIRKLEIVSITNEQDDSAYEAVQATFCNGDVETFVI